MTLGFKPQKISWKILYSRELSGMRTSLMINLWESTTLCRHQNSHYLFISVVFDQLKSAIMEMFQISISCFIAILALAFWFFKRKYEYWERMGVPTANTELRIPFGHIKGIGTTYHSHEIMKRLYNKLKHYGTPFAGMYFYIKPVVLVTSLDFAKTVLVKDSADFIDRGAYYNEVDQPLSGMNFKPLQLIELIIT